MAKADVAAEGTPARRREEPPRGPARPSGARQLPPVAEAAPAPAPAPLSAARAPLPPPAAGRRSPRRLRGARAAQGEAFSQKRNVCGFLKGKPAQDSAGRCVPVAVRAFTAAQR